MDWSYRRGAFHASASILANCYYHLASFLNMEKRYDRRGNIVIMLRGTIGDEDIAGQACRSNPRVRWEKACDHEMYVHSFKNKTTSEKNRNKSKGRPEHIKAGSRNIKAAFNEIWYVAQFPWSLEIHFNFLKLQLFTQNTVIEQHVSTRVLRALSWHN